MVDEEAPNPVDFDATAVETAGDSGDADGAGTEESNTDNAEAAMNTARAQAEARRRRILEKANNRMKYVNGEQVQDEEEKKSSRSNAARIRAARQRRYGKKAAAVAPATTAPALVSSPSITATPSDENSATAETFTSTNTHEAEFEKVGSDVLQEKTVDAESRETTSEENTVGATSKKKYVGVARMRRKMLVKKKMEEENNDPGVSSSVESESAKASLASDGKSSKGNSATGTTSVGSLGLPPVKVQTIPIYMHMIVILLLFVTGFDVGIQQFHVDIDVRTKVAVQEYGLPFLQRNPWHPLKPITTEKDSKQTLAEKLSSSSPPSLSRDLIDEFDGESEEEYTPPNIDPIFRIDLDELTKGPGFLNQMARGAISIHRLILWFFYYAPIGFIGAILSIPTAFIHSPPALFLAAVILRQVVGKGVLGATIPEDSEDDEDGAKKQNNIEVMAMAKNFIKNFFMTTFPTLVKLYDAYLHLKADMYVVLCGVFFGLAWSHLQSDSLSCDAGAPLTSEGEL